ncbi:hypothetical protein LZ30DRAFT_776118 [Colletotrichum cereale]|nr:hypothetical protein LZ30DRAFT_776118 [Colletotrichum cereale]
MSLILTPRGGADQAAEDAGTTVMDETGLVGVYSFYAASAVEGGLTTRVGKILSFPSHRGGLLIHEPLIAPDKPLGYPFSWVLVDIGCLEDASQQVLSSPLRRRRPTKAAGAAWSKDIEREYGNHGMDMLQHKLDMEQKDGLRETRTSTLVECGQQYDCRARRSRTHDVQDHWPDHYGAHDQYDISLIEKTPV